MGLADIFSWKLLIWQACRKQRLLLTAPVGDNLGRRTAYLTVEPLPRNREPVTPEETLELITDNTERWIGSQREAFRPSAAPLQLEDQVRLSEYCETETLQMARFAVTPRIRNPDFLHLLVQPGEPPPIDFSLMHGITFVDTVVFATWPGPPSGGLVAHELAHVVQYRILGLREFACQYVRGWAENGMQYETIPLEIQAYEIQDRFENPNERPFSIEETVRRQLSS